MKTQNIRDILGVTQIEMAAILGVSRSHIAMFEIGKRNLPIHANQILAQLLSHLQESNTFAKVDPHEMQQQTERRKHIENLLVENEYQRQILDKKIAAVERKVIAQGNFVKLANQILQSAANKNAESSHRGFLEQKSAKVESGDAGAILVKLQLKQELLEVERKYLQSLQGN